MGADQVSGLRIRRRPYQRGEGAETGDGERPRRVVLCATLYRDGGRTGRAGVTDRHQHADAPPTPVPTITPTPSPSPTPQYHTTAEAALRTLEWNTVAEAPGDLRRLAGFDDYVTDAVFSPDGRWIASSGARVNPPEPLAGSPYWNANGWIPGSHDWAFFDTPAAASCR